MKTHIRKSRDMSLCGTYIGSDKTVGLAQWLPVRGEVTRFDRFSKGLCKHCERIEAAIVAKAVRRAKGIMGEST